MRKIIISMIIMQDNSKNQKYHVGQNLDILDSVGKWVNAEVLFVGNGTIYVHYTGWSAKYDESIDIDSPRILTQWKPGKPIHLNNRVDAYHQLGGWLEARVIEIGQQSEKNYPVKVHFFNYHNKYDSWVNLKDNNQVAIIGSRSKAYGMGKKRCKAALMNAKLSQMIKKLLQERSKQLSQSLQEKGLIIKKSGGDGNCLFRSISDQLYGSQQYHQQIRKICMDYIAYEKYFFQDYVVDDIDQYIAKKRQNGVWGDDVQIQAISQIYARPIEIYVFGDKPIRTFHEQNQQNVVPIRLAYIGACHYDSVKRRNELDKGIMDTKCGQFEELFMSTYKSDMNGILRNRNLFSVCNRLEDTIGEQLLAQNREQIKIQDELTKALEVSENEAILEQIEKAELKEYQKQYQQEKIQQELKKIQEKQIEEAKKLSKTQNQTKDKPYWFDDLLALGYSEKEIWFAIEIKGYDPDAVQNFLLDNLCI